MSSKDLSTSEILKQKGNQKFQNKDYSAAIEYYTQAISIEPNNDKLFSNRSGAYTASHHYVEAEADAYAVIRLNPQWTKGYTRLGNSLIGQKRFLDAIFALNIALTISPNDQQIQDDIKNCNENNIDSSPVFFGVPFILSILKKHPAFSAIFENPAKLKLLRVLQDNSMSTCEFAQDSEIEMLIKASFEFLNCNPTFFETETTPNPIGSTLKKLTPAKIQEESQKNQQLKRQMPQKTNTEEAAQFTDQGNQLYQNNDYGGALLMYSRAINSDPDNPTYYSKRSDAFSKLDFHVPSINDSNKTIELQASNVKPYICRAKSYFELNWCIKSYEAYNEALVIETNNPESLAGIDMVINKIIEKSKKLYTQYNENPFNPYPQLATKTLKELSLYDSLIKSEWNYDLIKESIKNPDFRKAFESYEMNFAFDENPMQE